jgi:hypothetical protein
VGGNEVKRMSIKDSGGKSHDIKIRKRESGKKVRIKESGYNSQD